MIKAIYELDMTPRRTLPNIINVSQYDDIGRTFVFNLFSSSGKWTAPTSAAVTFEGGKPDGKFFSYNCAYSNGTVTVTIQQQMTAVAGKVRCKIKVTSGDKVVESAPIIMVVDAAAVPDGSDMSKSDINDAIANATQKIVDQVKDSIPSDYAQLSTDVSSLKQDLGNTKSQLSESIVDIQNTLGEEKSIDFTLVSGTFQIATGNDYDDNTKLRTEPLIHLSTGDKIAVDLSVQWCWARYTDREGTDFIDSRTAGFTVGDYTADLDAWYKFCFRYKNEPSKDISAETEFFKQYIQIFYTEPRTKIVKDVYEINERLTAIEEAGVPSKDEMKVAVKTEIIDRNIIVDILGADVPLGIINADNGDVISSSSIGYHEMDVEQNEVVSVYGYYITSSGTESAHSEKKINSVYAVDVDGRRVDDGCKYYNANLSQYIVPNRVKHIKFSFSGARNVYDHNVITRVLKNGQMNHYLRQRVNGKPFSYTGILSNETKSLGFENCWTNKVWMFSGLIKTFGATKIGACNRNNMIERPYVEITSNKVNVFSSLGEPFDKSFEHGLTIANDLQIFVKQGRTLYNESLFIQSNGQRWECDATSMRIGEPYYGIGISTTGSYSHVSASASILDIEKPVWVFGDSWVSLYESRWVGQAVLLGLDKCWMLDGHAGRTSSEALIALKNLLAVKQPKMIVWLMGMNDADINDSTPNASWLTTIEEVKYLCDWYDITLILYTIPSVPSSQGAYSGSARNNNAKNDYVISSGYRYVDGVSAFGADRKGNWIDGYWQSDTDHTHPSKKGAIALMMQIFADVPEMLCN